MVGLKVRPLSLVKLFFRSKAYMTYLVDVDKPAEGRVFIWLIEGTKERIIIDAGGSAETLTQRQYPSEQITTPDKALKELGLEPDDIDIVICTHLHSDHIEYAHLYRNAKFILQRAEFNAIRNPPFLQRGSYIPKSMYEGLNFELIEGDSWIADGVQVLSTPGHSVGGQSVLVEADEGRVVISGLCTLRENFQPPAPVCQMMPVIIPGIHVDVMKCFDSMLKIKGIADRVIPLHDPESEAFVTIP